MNFGVDTKKDRWEQHKEGNRYNAEVKALIDAKVHETTEKFEHASKFFVVNCTKHRPAF